MSLRTKALVAAAAVVAALVGGQLIDRPMTEIAVAAPATKAVSTEAKAAAQLTIGMTADQLKTSTAKRSLEAGKVAKEAAMKGYSRDKFPHWRDASTWGWPTAPNDACNARNAALYRDGKGVKMSAKCTNLTGSWLDPYTAMTLAKASEVDIDHMVPLAEAWRSGASSWTTKPATSFANDPLVLVSVQASANRSKGDKDPSAWMPANKASHCLYAKRWIAVKAKYKLAYDSAEKKALSKALGGC